MVGEKHIASVMRVREKYQIFYGEPQPKYQQPKITVKNRDDRKPMKNSGVTTQIHSGKFIPRN